MYDITAIKWVLTYLEIIQNQKRATATERVKANAVGQFNGPSEHQKLVYSRILYYYRTNWSVAIPCAA